MVNLHRQSLENLLIPVKKAAFQTGVFRWPQKPYLAGFCNDDALPLRQLKDDLFKYSVEARLARNPFGKAGLRVIRSKSSTNHEAYQLVIKPDGISVHSSSSAGTYYAVQTLRDIMQIFGNSIPCLTIEDEPDFARRGVYHDCSRGKVPKLSTLKELVTRLAHWKINELQLYIENVFTFKNHPEIGKGYSPFAPGEILELQEHCRKHHIRLVGSLASFGHFEKILSLPQYSHLGEMPGFRGFPGGTTLCPIDSDSIKLVEELYSEFVPLFDAVDFNVCCDETWELGRGRSQKKADKKGVGRVYLDFILKIYRLCERFGKRMNLWADIVLKYPELLDELPRDIVLLNWEYEQDGANIARTKEIAEANIPFMVCPGTSGWLTHGSRLSNAIGNVRNFAAMGRKYKAEGLLNTDWGDQGHRNFIGASLHGFAHGAAHSWNGRAVDDKKFTEKFCFSFFNQKTSKLAEAIKLLGNTYVTCGKIVKNKSLLYSALIEPLILSESGNTDAIDMMTEDGLHKILEQLSGKGIWPKPGKGANEFERMALKELALAARMDCLACTRALAGRKLRCGQTVRKTEFKKLSIQMHNIADDFKVLWLSRNKPSRLRDNLDLFRKAKLESERLAGQ
ncbi:MAG: family 20 glycosylhydrolase [Sedimentisphaerales bacterium]|nr:family 20 glycosylhydrolase [Sedimentisphaerales bacterium]